MRCIPILCLLLGVNVLSAEPKQDKPKFEKAVRVEFPKDGYTFTLDEAAKGIKIAYKIVVDDDVDGVIALQYGPSFREPAGASGLHPREKIAGNQQLYCLMDFGLAAPRREQDEVAKKLKKGVCEHSFTWEGRNWTGPSDFGNPKGKPFPAGTYDVFVTFHGKLVTDKGKRPYEISAKTKLVLK